MDLGGGAMRRYTATLAAAGLIAAVAAAAALAAMPATNHSFKGKGGSYTIQNGHWAVIGKGSYHFKTGGKRLQTNGTFVYIEGFSGTYLNCHGKKLLMTATNIAIPYKSGKFNWHSPHSYSGAFIRIWGSFGGSGDFAKINYLANFSGSNVNPSTIHGGCASWVRGTATTA
jgi:hypothetical protein